MNPRFKALSYTENDVLALYLKYREERIGPFVREVGDFIAHPKRDRGVALSHSVYTFSQAAYFRKYQSKPEPLLCIGKCP